jgi:uncharacterized repeat protein (TIGR01451 family)
MKKILLKLFLITAAFICLSQSAAHAGTVTILNAGDSMQVYCGAPFTVGSTVFGQTTGYASTDSVSVYQNFGDGNDTLFYIVLTQPTFYGWYDHTYQFPGVYSTLYIVTGPDGAADTMYIPNDIIDSANCGNIDGRLYIDANSNCIQDVGETDVAGAPVELWYNSTLLGTTYTSSNGYYYFYVPNNTYTIRPGPQISNYGYNVTCPLSGQITITSPSTNNNFGLTCTPGFDLQAYVWSQNFRPGFNRDIYPYLRNTNCQNVNGQAKLILDGTWLTFVSSATPPTTISGDTLIWDFTAVSNQGYFDPGPVTVYTSSSAPLGDSICVTLLAEPVSGDTDPANNSATVCRPITNAMDPNEKQVSPDGDIVSGSWLSYTIFFQNTGNDTAYNVFILDTMDANLDMSTFQPTAASHSYYTYIQDGNAVKFDFPNIMLVDSNANEPLSHGWVSYRIKSNTGLPEGTLLNNTAYIYFDFNEAVVTNTTVTVIDNSVAVAEINTAAGLFISPNPATDQLSLSSQQSVMVSVELFDVLGEQVYHHQQTSNSRQQTIDVSNLAPGIYMVRVKTDAGIKAAKFVKE